MSKIKSICVYCGSQSGDDSAFTNAAQILGIDFAMNQIKLVYGGGTTGIMGALASAVEKNGGEIMGIIPEFLMRQEQAAQISSNRELVVTRNMHERKQLMFERSDAFIAMPGGIGTLEEIVEIMTWAQLGKHSKPMVFANINGFWDPMLELINHMKDMGFVHSPQNMQPLVISDSTEIVPTLLEL